MVFVCKMEQVCHRFNPFDNKVPKEKGGSMARRSRTRIPVSDFFFFGGEKSSSREKKKS
jgi:hypothetical protein